MRFRFRIASAVAMGGCAVWPLLVTAVDGPDKGMSLQSGHTVGALIFFVVGLTIFGLTFLPARPASQ